MRRWVKVGFFGVAACVAPLVLPDCAAVGSEGLASCEWSGEVEIDGAGDGLGGCVCVVVCPFIAQEMAGGFGDGGVARDLRVGTSARGAMPVGAAEKGRLRTDKNMQISRPYEEVRCREKGN